MTYSCFDVSVSDKVAHIVMTRPEKRNSMNSAFWRELPEIVRDLDASGEVRAIVISSTGPIFSAGIDLSMFATDVAHTNDKNDPTYGMGFYDGVKRLQDSFNAIEDCRVPVIAAIQGGCIGGGVDLVTACDIRLMTEDAYLTIYEINVGMTADVGTFPRILNHLPEGIVRELAYTGRRMGAEEAQSFGVVNRTYPNHDALVAGALELAAEIATKPPLAVTGCKRIITYSRDHSTADALDNIAVWNMSMLIPTEMMEAMQAKGQKRAGNYADLPPRKKA